MAFTLEECLGRVLIKEVAVNLISVGRSRTHTRPVADEQVRLRVAPSTAVLLLREHVVADDRSRARRHSRADVPSVLVLDLHVVATRSADQVVRLPARLARDKAKSNDREGKPHPHALQ